MENEKSTYKIGETARRAGVHKETVRYYEKRKLIPKPDLLIIPKDPRFTKRHYLKLILDSVRCPVLLVN